MPSVLITHAANSAGCTSCTNAQPKNSTVAQAVYVDIPKISSCTGAARLHPKNLAQFRRKNSTSTFCISAQDPSLQIKPALKLMLGCHISSERYDQELSYDLNRRFLGFANTKMDPVNKSWGEV